MTITVKQPRTRSTALRHREPAASRRLHRGFFAVMGLLPGSLAASVRAAYFEARFASGTPWPYDTCAYETAKRDALVAAVQPDARVVLEVGAADGHNLPALAGRAPDATIVGLDVSEQACDLARRRTVGQPRVVVEACDLPRAAERLPWTRRSVDTLILAEVLYYLGGTRSTEEQLAPVDTLLSARGRVILLHGSPDADRLHARAARALGLPVSHEHRAFADGRDYLLTVLEREDVARPNEARHA